MHLSHCLQVMISACFLTISTISSIKSVNNWESTVTTYPKETKINIFLNQLNKKFRFTQFSSLTQKDALKVINIFLPKLCEPDFLSTPILKKNVGIPGPTITHIINPSKSSGSLLST